MSTRRAAPRAGPLPWEFKARVRRHAFGWRSRPAVRRVREAVGEIRKVARRDPVLAAEGAVLFLERVAPAIEHVEGQKIVILPGVGRASRPGVGPRTGRHHGYR